MSWQTIVKENNLEVAVIDTKQLLVDNPNTRIDSDFFRRSFLQDDETVKTKKWAYLGDVSKSIINFGAYSLTNQIEFLEEGVPYINVADIKENNILVDNAKRIDEKLSETVLKKSLALEGQVLLTIAGTIGNASVAYGLPKNTNSNQAIANITLNDDVSPFYVSTYLNSKYGKSQTGRLTISSVQPNLLLTQVKLIKIALPTKPFQDAIEKAYKDYQSLVIKSAQIYKEAEQVLLKEINLEGYKGTDEAISVRNFSEALTDNRFDAEYWQPKYDDLFTKLQRADTLGKIAVIKSGSLINPNYYSDYGTPYIRGADFSKNELDDDGMVYIKSDFKISKETLVKENDIIFPSVGSVGKTAIVTKKYEKAFISNNLGKITIISKEYLPQYVQVCLQSLVGQLQLERLQTQTAQPKITDIDMARIKIPFISKETQRQIVEKIEKSRELKLEAKVLLEKAKRAVEIFVEKDEKEALKYI